MAILQNSLLLSCSVLLLLSISNAQTSFRPKALVLKISKDDSTKQYLTTIPQGTPRFPAKLTLDLGGEFMWVDCESGFNSWSRKPVPCRSAQCNLAGTKACTSNPNPADDVCVEFPINTVINLGSSGDFSSDSVEIQSTDGKNPGRSVAVRSLLFTCAPKLLMEGLAGGVVGMAGLGRIKIALPLQLSAAFSFPRKFAVCLSSSADGFVIFGDGPYVVSPGFDVSKALTYTPLIRNPVNLIGGFPGEASAEYFIGVKSIKVDGKPVPVNTSLLSFDSEGHGGAKISTVDPYTLMETTIHNAVVDAFVAAMAGKNIARVSPVSPFSACFGAKDIGVTRAGPAVPPIELVLQNERTVWRIQGSNSMVRVSNDVLCLGIVDGGPLHFVDWGVKFTPTSIVIGGHQIEDNLVQIDLAASKLGFSSSLLTRQSSCSNFNFTSIA